MLCNFLDLSDNLTEMPQERPNVKNSIEPGVCLSMGGDLYRNVLAEGSGTDPGGRGLAWWTASKLMNLNQVWEKQK